MKRTGPPARRTPLRSVSPRRAAQNRLYSMRRRVFLAAHPLCEVCGQVATDVHHRRGRVGADLLDEAHWTALCRECHRVVTVEPAWAMSVGLSESRVGTRS